MIAYNDEVVSAGFGNVVGMSVIGIYATIVYAVGIFIRLIFDRISQRVIYEEMPCTDKILEICEGIFIAQLEGDLEKEKRMFILLIKIYRSPDLIMDLTGVKLDYTKKNQEL